MIGRKEGKERKREKQQEQEQARERREGGREKRKEGREGEERKEEVLPPHAHGGSSQWPRGLGGCRQSREPEALR